MTDKPQPAPMRRRYETTVMLPRRKRVKRLLLVLMLCATMLYALMACSALGTKPPLRQSEPTPLVACNEHQPADALPADPQPPAVESPDQLSARHASASDYASQYRQLYDHVLAKYQRDVIVAGVVQQLRIQRAATADCLDGYRRRGVIL